MKSWRLLRIFCYCTMVYVVIVVLLASEYGIIEMTHDDDDNDDAIENMRQNYYFMKTVEILNQSGGPWERIDSLIQRLDREVFADPSIALSIKDRINREVQKMQKSVQPWAEKGKIDQTKSTITVGTIVCGQSRREQLINMLKSLLIFSMDATLHLVVFSDVGAIVDAAQDILSLKLVMQERFGTDFTFEIHLDQFPDNGVRWKKMYRLCATQRLFFPDLLPHIDSLIYIDTDMLVLSNMTNLWEHFKTHMEEREFGAAAMNNEDTAEGWYGPRLQIPYYGKRGINAGLMLMNLTRMRSFGFANTSIEVNKIYKSRIHLADQDIVNIIFATYPEYFSVLPCSYNFHWAHCGNTEDECYDKKGENFCFCRAALKDGIKILHGNFNTFQSTNQRYSHLPQTYNTFNRFNMITDDPRLLIASLIRQFNLPEQTPCKPLSSHILYNNAMKYLDNLYASINKTIEL